LLVPSAKSSPGGRPIVLGAGDDHPFAMLTLLLIVLVVMAIGAAPSWPHSRNWGYYPSGGIGLVVIVLLVLAFTGHMRL
jgi:hypothetical protein